MTQQSNDTEQETPLENIRDLKKHYHEQHQEAIADKDEVGAAYLSGIISGLIHAEETVQDD